MFQKLIEMYYRIRIKINEIKLKLLGKYWYKPHLIDTKLDPNGWWIDKDDLMLHGMMSLLEDYVEKEKCFEKIDFFNDDERHAFIGNEIKTIYEWWKNHKNRLDDIDNALDCWAEVIEVDFKDLPDGGKEMKILSTPLSEKLNNDLQQKEKILFEEETDMLCRLIKIRNTLWT